MSVMVLMPIALVIVSAVAMAMGALGRPNRELNFCYTAFARLGIWSARTRLRVHGLDHVDPDHAYVVVPNHESNWDPVCIMAALPRLVIRFVAKRQIMQIPMFGWALRLTGNIEVARRRGHDDVKRIQHTMARRDPSVSMLFFAEGTRARDGSYRKFKMGAFATAIDDGLSILPIAVAGTAPIWRPGSAWFRPGTVVVEIGEPIPTDDLGREDRAALRDRVHQVVGRLRAGARERLRTLGQDPGGID